MNPTAIWERYYQTGDALALQSQQNTRLARSFGKALHGNPVIHAAIVGANRVLEVGCGTGELSLLLATQTGADITGIDLSETAVAFARDHYGVIGKFAASGFDDPALTGRFDLVVSSNVLEHFAAWRDVLTRWLEIAPLVLLLVPYRETWPLGKNKVDGGRAHVATFDEYSFDGEAWAVSWFTFESAGWQVGENPRQLAILLEAR